MNVLELDETRRGILLADGKRLTFGRGDILYTPGDVADCIFAIESGRIKIVRSSANGSESIVGIRNPGDIFGELSWMTPEARRTTSAIALDPSTICRLDATVFERRLRADATLAASFARGAAQRLSAIGRELTELAGKSVPGRLVDALGRLAADHGVREDDGTLRIALSLTHKDLADLIGTSRETLTKELSVLADVGLLRVAHRTIVLLQPQAFPFARTTPPSRT
ncbi:MAG: Crp/Fnr family transcriptional regulator [Candidatus Eremiobacteraeota bacterium]|nr:Crp/Fnr family transcriptional regulator [Candidatus Eremiobacteraeota bacterium]